MEEERSSGQDIVLFFNNNAATAKVIQNEIRDNSNIDGGNSC
jgi:hypothetical protein